MSGPGALLASARFEYGIRPPPARRANPEPHGDVQNHANVGPRDNLEPLVGVEPRANADIRANLEPLVGVEPRANADIRANLEPHADVEPRARAETRADLEARADVEPRPHRGAETPIRLPRCIRRLAGGARAASVPGRVLNILMLVSFVLAALAWLSAPRVCPTSDSYTPSFQSRGDAHGARHEKATNMYFDAIKWMRHLQVQARRNSRANNALATRAAELAEKTRRLAESTSALKIKFEESHMDEASGLAYLEARLLRARGETQFYQDAGWLWLLRLGCMSCGRVTHTTSCPEHPALVAAREIDVVRDVLLGISKAHRDLMKEHRAIQNSTLKPAHDEICASGAQGQPGHHGDLQSQSKDFEATAFGVCRLTGRELQRGTDFRDEFASRVGERVGAALNDVHDISKKLGDTHTRVSWSPGDLGLGLAVLDALVDVVTAQKAGGEEDRRASGKAE